MENGNICISDARHHMNFEGAMRRGFINRIASRLNTRENHLLALETYLDFRHIEQRIDRGTQIIELGKIEGSVGRTLDFDRNFMPRKRHIEDRWVNIDRAFCDGQALPPVELLQVGDTYFVQDGHHRISVARSHNQEFIDAHVIEIIVS